MCRLVARHAGAVRIHLDTDFGGDTDDACALAMLLGWPDVELTGITTAIDPGGRRAGYVAHLLDLAGRTDIPVAAGAEVSLTTQLRVGPVTDERHWPKALPARPAPPGAALDLLAHSIESGATVVGIGPYTNLALLEIARPGLLDRTPMVLMGGWVRPPARGLPRWGPEMDFNVQWDTRAAQIVTTASAPTLVTLPATLSAYLRAADLPALRGCGPLGTLLASQAEAHAQQHRMNELGRAHAALPDDLLNFQYDPVAGAVAAGWPGVTVEPMRLRPVLTGQLLRFEPDRAARPMPVVTEVDGPGFAQSWLSAVRTAGANPPV